MKYVIFSDNHGDSEAVDLLMDRYPNLNFISLGDFELDKYYCNRVSIRQVKGNSFFDPDFPTEIIFYDQNYKIFCTHGHKYSAHWTNSYLIDKARSIKADIVLFGHTHIPLITLEEKTLLINPGSLKFPRGSIREKTYAIMEIAEAITIEIKELYTGETLKCKKLKL